MSIAIEQNVGRTTQTKQTAQQAPARQDSQTPTIQTATQTTAQTAARPVPAPPSVHRRLLLTWLAVYPTITTIQFLLGSHIAHLALPVRTLIVTAMVAPVMVYVALPQIMKLDRRIAHRVAARRG